MGIPGLWAELASAAQTTTLPSYCLSTFTENDNELRGLRLGIDASLWLFHAQQSSGGANPYLRLLFYRLAKLLTLPVLPLFVFDGPSRPTWKRGKQVRGRQHAIEQPFTQLIEAFGYEWHRAPGEAEAELAYLNQAGFVDAVLTDDSDALLFGAQVLIRNWGKNLSGTKALSRTTSTSSDVFDDTTQPAGDAAPAAPKPQLSGSDRDHLITLYRARDLANMPSLGIDRDGLILIALMSGGDYDTTGLLQCGVKIALALARGGYGTTLVNAFKASYPDQASASRSMPAFDNFVKGWLEEVRDELRTNERGFLPSRRPKLASTIEESFLSTQESRKVLAYYVYPLTSKHKDDGASSSIGGKSAEPDLTRMARLSQLYFNWSKEAILSKFRTILGPGVVARRLRQEILEHNDGAGEGPWAALVESPASKAVRRHMLGLDGEGMEASSNAQRTSKAAAVTTSQKKQRPLHESPNATRITDFFAKAGISSRSDSTTTTTRATSTNESVTQSTGGLGSIQILAVKMQRRHAALDPFLDYRVLISMEEFTKAAEMGIDAKLDAELAAARAHDRVEDDPSDAEMDDDEGGAGARSTTAHPKRIPPDTPLLMWIPEPFLKLSISGSAPLSSFLRELERKAEAARIKASRKPIASSRAKAAQRTLNDFVKPSSKPSLTTGAGVSRGQVAKASSFTAGQTMQKECERDSVTAATPMTPRRQLRVPSGMQRRTESFPSSSTTPAPTTTFAPGVGGKGRSFNRHVSMPDRAEPETLDEGDGDSSIEFLGSLVKTRTTAAAIVHDRPSTPPSQTGTNRTRGDGPNKSPRKLKTPANPTSPNTAAKLFAKPSFAASGLPRGSQKATRPSRDDFDDDDDHDQGSHAQYRSTVLTRGKSKPRISAAITISDDSSSE